MVSLTERYLTMIDEEEEVKTFDTIQTQKLGFISLR
jgi:hypothetical protein